MPDLRGPYKLFFRGGAISEEYVRGELEIEYEHGSPLLGLRFSGYILLTRADDRSQERRDITGRYSFPDRAYFTDADMATVTEVGAFYFHGAAFVPSNLDRVIAIYGDVGRLEVTQVGDRLSIHPGWESSPFLAVM
jgi:hypothetical protein